MKEQADKGHDGVSKISYVWVGSIKAIFSKELGPLHILWFNPISNMY